MCLCADLWRRRLVGGRLSLVSGWCMRCGRSCGDIACAWMLCPPRTLLPAGGVRARALHAAMARGCSASSNRKLPPQQLRRRLQLLSKLV